MKYIISLYILLSTLNASSYGKNHNNGIEYKNSYLFTLNNHHLNAGLYCANVTTKKVHKMHGGTITKWQAFKEKNSLKVVIQTNSGRKGLGYTALVLLNINETCTLTENKTILEYNYDMESGLCGRESLNLEKSADLKKLEFDSKKNLVKINLIEQQCSSKKISTKNLTFDISKEQFINQY